MLHALRKCLVIRECTNKKKLIVLVANMKCRCTAMAHRADPQAHRGGGGTITILRGWGGSLQAAHHICAHASAQSTLRGKYSRAAAYMQST